MNAQMPDSRFPADGAPARFSQIRVALQILLTLAVIAFCLWALYRLERVILVLILAGFFAYVIAPLVRLAERPVSIAGRPRHLSRAAAILLVYLVIAAGSGIGAAILLPRVTQQVNEAVSRAPEYTTAFRGWQRSWSRYYERLRIPVEMRQGIDQAVVGAGDAAIVQVRGSLMAVVGAAAYVPWLILIPVLAFFLLRDATSFRRALVRALPRTIRTPVRHLFGELDMTLAAYVRAQLLACALVGTTCGVGFAILGVPYAALLGILAGVLEFIPLVGPFIVAVVAIALAALHSPVMAIWTIGFLGLLRVAEDYVIYPRLIGRGIHLHPFVVVLAVLAGLELSGVVGIFIAVPVVAVLSVVGRRWIDWRGEEPIDSAGA